MNLSAGIEGVLTYLKDLDRPVQVLAACLIAHASLCIAYVIFRRHSLSQLRHDVERLRHELDLLRVNVRISQIKPSGRASPTTTCEPTLADPSSPPSDPPAPRTAPPGTSHVRPIQWLSLD